MKPIKYIFLVIGFILCNVNILQAQSETKETVPQENVIYKLEFKKEVDCIQDLRYDKLDKPIKGWLSEDKLEYYLENYEMNNKIWYTVHYTDGSNEKVLRTPCTIKHTTRQVL
ncbi:MAG TPA: hypothetical protein PKH65_06740 [Bacteroidia bacterium]|nr:hypothetical protein [Bacteroidia bacterium]HNT80365.1 hypothetical protein [Bacteroidia bacterium]